MSGIILHPHDHKTIRDWHAIIRFLNDTIPFHRISAVLEVAGGYGNIAYHYACRGVSGVILDINPEYIHVAEGRHRNIEGLVHDFNTPLPFSDASFDVVTCIGALSYSYAHDASKILRELARVSRAYVIVDVLSRYAPYRYIETLYNPTYAPRRHTLFEAESLLSSVGLSPCTVMGSKLPHSLSMRVPFMGKSVIYITHV